MKTMFGRGLAASKVPQKASRANTRTKVRVRLKPPGSDLVTPTESGGMRRTPNASRNSGALVLAPAFGVRRIPPLFVGRELTDSFNRTPNVRTQAVLSE